MSKAKLRADAINRFIVDAKSQGVYNALKASSVMAGWDSLAGALTPLAGTAPTNNGFLAADYDRGTGLKGDGTSYLDTGRAVTADPQNNCHVSAFRSDSNGSALSVASLGAATTGAIVLNHANPISGRLRNTPFTAGTLNSSLGFAGFSRQDSGFFSARADAQSETITQVSATSGSVGNYGVFMFLNGLAISTATLAFYSIGTSVDLSVMDSLVSRLLADFRSIDEDGMDRDALAYIRNVEAADGGYLELGVKKAIDTFVRGCKYDGIWNAIKASALLCGARTLAGALTPLAGAAPSNNNFVDADYNRETGLKGNLVNKHLQLTGVYPDGPVQDSAHQALYVSEQTASATFRTHISETGGTASTQISQSASQFFVRCQSGEATGSESPPVGFAAVNRSISSSFSFRRGGVSSTFSVASLGIPDGNALIYRLSSTNSDARLAFYSIGSAIDDLADFDARVTALVTAIGAAL